MSWFVYRLTNSAFMLGLIGFLNQIPSFFIAPLAGVLADRRNRRSVLIVTQILSMTQALFLAFLVFSGLARVWNIAILSFFLGLVNSFDTPTRQSFVIELVEEKKDLNNAIALNSAMFNAARLVGPSIAGIIIAILGEGMCFLLNGVSYIAVIIALFSMRILKRNITKTDVHVITHLKEGFYYCLSFPADPLYNNDDSSFQPYGYVLCGAYARCRKRYSSWRRSYPWVFIGKRRNRSFYRSVIPRLKEKRPWSW